MVDSMKSNTQFQLTGTLSVTWSSVTVSNDLERDSAITATEASVVIHNADDTIRERMQCTFAAWTMTVVMRWLDQSETKTEVAWLKKERKYGSYWYITTLASDLLDVDSSSWRKEISSDIDFTWDNTHSGDNTYSWDSDFTWSIKVPVYADATARDAAITSPANWMECYLTDTGKFYDYTWGSWVARESWGTFPNGSETVAGKREWATLVEQWAHTETWWTWAWLVLQCKNTVKEHEIYTPAYLTGWSSATTRWATWTAVTDWTFSIDIDWVTRDVTWLDFSSTTNEDDIASVIQAWIRALTSSTETCVWSTDHFVISSVDTTSSSAITVTSAEGTGTDISWAGATEFMDCETWVGTVTNAVVDPTQDENKIPVLKSDGKLDQDVVNYSGAITPTNYTLWENMTALDIASVRDDGYIYKFDGNLSAEQTESISKCQIDQIVKLTDTLVVWVYYDGSVSYDNSAVVGTISWDTITRWTPVQMSDWTTDSNIRVCRLEDDKFAVLSEKNNANPRYAYAIVCTVSGTTITKWTPVQLNTQTWWAWHIYDIVKAGTDKFVCAFNQPWWVLHTLVACTVSGTTITNWAELNAAQTYTKLWMVDDDIFMAYDSTNGRIYRCTVSWTTITEGNFVALAAAYTQPHFEWIDTTNQLFAWTTWGNVYALMVNGTPTTPTIWAVLTVDETATSEWLALFGTDWFAVSCGTSNAIVYCKIVWTTLTINNEYDVTEFWWEPLATIDDDRFLMYKSDTTWAAQDIITTFVNNDYTRIQWILQASWSTWDSKEVALPWQVSSWHSSLLVGCKYRMAADWTLTLSNATWTWYWILVWTSLSATTLLVQIPYEDL